MPNAAPAAADEGESGNPRLALLLSAAMFVLPATGLLGPANSFRMKRRPDVTPMADIDGAAFG